MIKDFIEEYKNAYLVEFESGFWGDVDKISAKLTDPKNHPSIYLINHLNSLKALKNKPLNIAVVGQFSSGKSTFLNTLLKSEILPTGVVPVTAKVTKIEYAPFSLLKVTQNDGSDELKNVSELKNYTDQRQNLKNVKDLTIYNSSEVLKKATFSDTPGLNSRSKADTNETMKTLQKADGLLWISLIDNAARASEKDDILGLPEHLKNHSLCLLSQKDRLNDEEIARVLGHAKSTFAGAFKDILAISSRMEQKGEKNSGFDEIYAFLNEINANKENIAKERILGVIDTLKAERKDYIEIYEKLENILGNWGQNSVEIELLEGYRDEFAKFYAKIKEISSEISSVFMKSIKSEKSEYYTQDSGLFGKEKYKKNEYEKPYFNKDEALMHLIYNDDNLATIFRRLRTALKKLQEQISDEILQNYKSLENEVLLFKSEFETLVRQNELHSVLEIAYIARIASEVYELFLKNIEREYFKFNQNLALFFEKIKVKIIHNYRNSVKLSADFIGDKVLKSVQDYESDPLTFSLFYPKFEDFNNAMLENLQYFEFENDFVGEKAFIKRAVENLLDEKAKILAKNIAYIHAQKSRHSEIIANLESCKEILT